MFLELYVENLALIEAVNLQWQPGLNVLTGETGAGKSMVIDAVALLLGGRASQDYIRKGAELCRVQGTFAPPFPAGVLAKLAELGFVDEAADSFDDCLLLTRELNRNGKTVCRVNLRPVPLAAFRELSRQLINIHGQMEHMSLLEPEQQRQMLDSFGDGKHQQCLETVATAYEVWQQKQQELRQLQRQGADQEERRQLLQFQLEELAEAQLQAGEEEVLAAEAKVLQNAEALSEHAWQAWDCLNGGNQPPLAATAKALEHLQTLAEIDPGVQETRERLQNLYYELEDITYVLRDYKNSIISNPQRLDEIETRIFQLRGLCKKYGGTVEHLLELAENHKKMLAQWENREELLAACSQEEAKLAVAYHQQAAKLRAARQATGERLAAAITQQLRELQMPQAQFAVVLEEAPPSLWGTDEVVFFIAPNPGEGLKPVAKIASGGEMARIMLSIKVILAQLDAIPTLIFDEIDTGLGGAALVSVAEKLTQIARSTQAICVTHAPVLAAYADQNLLVAKATEGDRTITKVEVLDQPQKLQEISRMLAGNHVTAATTRQAQELIDCGIALKK